MGEIQDVFRRVEKKYLLTREQTDALLPVLRGRLLPDPYGEYTISNIYYDTDDFQLIRRSLERPIYKEKLRMRAYGLVDAHSEVFLEIKRKFRGVVYKRRVQMPLPEARRFLETGCSCASMSQIHREIQYFLRQNPVSPKAFIAYDRVGLIGEEGEGLRVTLDRGIRFRTEKMALEAGTRGNAILAPDETLMEVKFSGAMPLWLAHALSEFGVCPTTFSKYGRCYEMLLQKERMRRSA